MCFEEGKPLLAFKATLYPHNCWFIPVQSQKYLVMNHSKKHIQENKLKIQKLMLPLTVGKSRYHIFLHSVRHCAFLQLFMGFTFALSCPLLLPASKCPQRNIARKGPLLCAVSWVLSSLIKQSFKQHFIHKFGN